MQATQEPNGGTLITIPDGCYPSKVDYKPIMGLTEGANSQETIEPYHASSTKRTKEPNDKFAEIQKDRDVPLEALKALKDEHLSFKHRNFLRSMLKKYDFLL